ncbi:MAG: hypothetical protein ACKOX6_09915 [Bdellovibrio sp.]
MTTPQPTISMVISKLIEGQTSENLTLDKIVQPQFSAKNEGVAFIHLSTAISEDTAHINWPLLMKSIEQLLNDPIYEKYWDTICTHLLEGFSNLASSNRIDPQMVREHAGHQTRMFIEEYEAYMGGKGIFKT